MSLRLMLLVLLALSTVPLSAQTIEGLHTDDQVLAFVRSLYADYSAIKLPSARPGCPSAIYRQRISKYASIPYIKADFDNNGQIDLLFNGYCPSCPNSRTGLVGLVILSFGKDNFRVIDLTRDRIETFFASSVLSLNGQNFIQTVQIKHLIDDTCPVGEGKLTFDTLTYAFDNFIEKARPFTGSIEKVVYYSDGVYVKKLAFRNDSARMESAPSFGTQANGDSGGIFVARIRPAEISQLYGLLKAIDFPHLQDQYEAERFHGAGGYFRIEYNNGKVKWIRDRNRIGTYGLMAIHELIDKIEKTQTWQKIGPVQDVNTLLDPYDFDL